MRMGLTAFIITVHTTSLLLAALGGAASGVLAFFVLRGGRERIALTLAFAIGTTLLAYVAVTTVGHVPTLGFDVVNAGEG